VKEIKKRSLDLAQSFPKPLSFEDESARPALALNTAARWLLTLLLLLIVFSFCDRNRFVFKLPFYTRVARRRHPSLCSQALGTLHCCAHTASIRFRMGHAERPTDRRAPQSWLYWPFYLEKLTFPSMRYPKRHAIRSFPGSQILTSCPNRVHKRPYGPCGATYRPHSPQSIPFL
jgi:hypothetical protein